MLPSYGAPGPRSALAHAASGFNKVGDEAGALSTKAAFLSRAKHHAKQAPGAGGAPSQSTPGQGQQQPQAQQSPTGDPSTDAVAAASQPFDLNADPVLQQVQAAVTLGNSQAQSSALNARDQALLGYGDPALAAQVLGSSDPMVAAAGQNPESTLALLKRNYNQGLWNFDNTLDPSLVYSGARIRGEQQLGQTYQDNLASAAANIQSTLAGINDSLNQALQGNQDRYDNALSTAYQNAISEALANPPVSFNEGAPPTPTTPSRLVHAAVHHHRTRPIRQPH